MEVQSRCFGGAGAAFSFLFISVRGFSNFPPKDEPIVSKSFPVPYPMLFRTIHVSLGFLNFFPAHGSLLSGLAVSSDSLRWNSLDSHTERFPKEGINLTGSSFLA